MTYRLPTPTHVGLLTAAVLSCALGGSAAAQEMSWDLSPCRIHAVLAIDVEGGLAEELEALLPDYLDRRITTAIGPAWSFATEVASGAVRHRVLAEAGEEREDGAIFVPSNAGSSSGSATTTDLFPSSANKLLLLSVRSTPSGYEIAGREYDRYVQRWGRPIRRECRQLSALAEQLFVLVWDVVAPLVQLELDPRDEHHVMLQLRGASLPAGSDDAQFIKPGDVLVPYLRRVTRDGEVVEDGIQVVPWAYLEVAESQNGTPIAQVYSGTRRPFGVRRRGRIEQVAIALRGEPGESAIRLHSRQEPDKPLVGYEVHAQNPGSDRTQLVGRSDGDGRVVVPPAASRIQMLYIKHGEALLARVPVVPGAEREMDVPLPDDDVRLQAEVRLAALREELVDVVARRSILMSRIRQKIAENDFREAQALLLALDRLPSRAQFNQSLAREARLHRSDDPQVQQSIDRLISTTQVVLGRYLDTKPVSDLHDELRQAQQRGS